MCGPFFSYGISIIILLYNRYALSSKDVLSGNIIRIKYDYFPFQKGYSFSIFRV